MGASSDDTVAMLLAWKEDDPYGFCNDLEREAVKVLNRDGLDVFVRQARAKFESAAELRAGAEQRALDYERRRWGGVLKTLLAARRDIEAYVSFCEQTELTPDDCRTIAQMYRSRRRPAEALDWVERGLAIPSGAILSSADHELREMQRALLAKLGRLEEALQSAWAEFLQHPATFSYKELMRYVPANQRKAWHEKAMEASEDSDLNAQIDLWLDRKEIDRLVARIHRAPDRELEAISHYRTEPLAQKLKRSHPEVAARVYRALCMRIVNAGKSNYYYAALENLEKARQCYTKAGLDEEWEALAAEIRELHYRKKAFMPGFERIVSGRANRVEPAFLERARRRWAR
ncbi:MAG: hypothetical protein GY953_43305 [bacterium]|nr:hypothetical protein [bacterium]